MTYYIVQAYSKQIDNKYKTHLYPSYLTSYELKFGGAKFGLQSGLCDALKFVNEDTAKKWKAKGEEVFGHLKEFDIVPIDARILGKVIPHYVIVD